MADRIQIRRDTAANWTSVNPTLAQGEVGLETDTLKRKCGNGASAWAALPYLEFASSEWTHNLGATQPLTIDPTQVTGIPNSSYGQLLTVPTGYSGNDIVEPSVLFDASAPFLGYEYVLCAAPYYQSNAVYENPCLWVSHDGNAWVPVVNGVPTPNYAGTATPVVASGVQGDGNNADPHLYRGPDGTYYITWYQILNAGGTGGGVNNSGIKIIKAPSLAGPWSTPVLVTASNYTGSGTPRPENPSMFWDGYIWHLYGVDLANTSGTFVVHFTNTSADPTAGTWVQQTNPTIPIPSAYSSQVWWHLNAYFSGGHHFLLLQDSKAGTSLGGNLWLVSSLDGGSTWNVPPNPFIPQGQNQVYRSALIFSAGGGIDLFYGRRTGSAAWELRRTRLMIAGPLPSLHGGLDASGVPVNSKAVNLAKVPIAPYVFGDTVNRADSSTSPGTADSGQPYTVSAGTVGVASKQLYAVTAVNTRAALTTTGCADGVTTAEMSVVDTSTQTYLITRYQDSSNYVRYGYVGGTLEAQLIVAGAVSISVSMADFMTPANGDVLAIVHQGGSLSFYQNGRLMGSVTGWTTNDTASGVGVQFSGTVARMRNITQRPLVNGA